MLHRYAVTDSRAGSDPDLGSDLNLYAVVSQWFSHPAPRITHHQAPVQAVTELGGSGRTFVGEQLVLLLDIDRDQGNLALAWSSSTLVKDPPSSQDGWTHTMATAQL